MLRIGTAAPDFTALLDDGSEFTLSAHRGRAVVLYFYPKDETSGCTTQACSFRDGYGQVRALGASIFGISADSRASHAHFRQHYSLPFSLISDAQKRIRKLYEAEALFGLLPARTTYVIDGEGIIQHAFRSDFRPGAHLEETIAALRRISPKSKPIAA